MSSTDPPNNPTGQCIVLTPGEPAGIGPDLAIALAAEGSTAQILFVADPDLMAERAAALGRPLRITTVAGCAAAAAPTAPGSMQLLPVATAVPVRCGITDPRNARYVLACLDRAVDACRDGRAAAMVTGPVHKAVINDAGIAFTGHTEYLADRLQAPLPVMMLVAGTLRVALLTTHVPLREVADLISGTLVERVVTIMKRDLVARFGIAAPRIGVCGLNPHAGEGGHLGHEEIDIIAPALDALRARGIDVSGPLPADTIFAPRNRQAFDAILALYHDQGLTALKALSFGDAVNVTLGLPVIRTSVDHGTALDLAGSGSADGGSLRAAVALAMDLVRRRAPS